MLGGLGAQPCLNEGPVLNHFLEVQLTIMQILNYTLVTRIDWSTGVTEICEPIGVFRLL